MEIIFYIILIWCLIGFFFGFATIAKDILENHIYTGQVHLIWIFIISITYGPVILGQVLYSKIEDFIIEMRSK
jgi:hypothetical protein